MEDRRFGFAAATLGAVGVISACGDANEVDDPSIELEDTTSTANVQGEDSVDTP